MLFDRFSFRERESGLPEEDGEVADLPTESRSYSFTLDTRQMMFLVAGYCFLCVLVFALGVVVGRATNDTEMAAVADTTVASQSRQQTAAGTAGSCLQRPHTADPAGRAQDPGRPRSGIRLLPYPSGNLRDEQTGESCHAPAAAQADTCAGGAAPERTADSDAQGGGAA